MASENLGVFSGNGFSEGISSITGQLWVQTVSMVVTFVYMAVVSFVLYKIVDLIVGLRVDDDEKTQSLDISQHDACGYIL